VGVVAVSTTLTRSNAQGMNSYFKKASKLAIDILPSYETSHSLSRIDTAKRHIDAFLNTPTAHSVSSGLMGRPHQDSFARKQRLRTAASSGRSTPAAASRASSGTNTTVHL